MAKIGKTKDRKRRRRAQSVQQRYDAGLHPDSPIPGQQRGLWIAMVSFAFANILSPTKIVSTTFDLSLRITMSSTLIAMILFMFPVSWQPCWTISWLCIENG